MASPTKIRRALGSPGALRMTHHSLSEMSLLAKQSELYKPSIRRHFHRRGIHENCTRTTRATTRSSGKKLRPIDAIGIVAAVCRPSDISNAKSEGIIGLNGKLPWGSLPSDREIFERLTRDRIMVLGRKTLLNERDGDLDHVRHAKHCIVVSKSISTLSNDPRLARHNCMDSDLGFLKLARSLDEALDLARDLAAATELDSKSKADEIRQGTMDDTDTETGDNVNNGTKVISSLPSSSSNIQCWVAGGEQLYEESLQHRSVKELHLSVIDVEIDLSTRGIEHVAMFPPKHRWAKNFNLASKISFPAESKTQAGTDENPEPSFQYHIYERIV